MTPELPPRVRDVVDGINAEDPDTFVSAFTDDAVVDDWGRTFVGPEQIAGWNRSDNLDKHTRIRVTGYRHDGEDHVVSIDVTGSGYSGPGTFTFRLADDGRVTRLDVT